MHDLCLLAARYTVICDTSKLRNFVTSWLSLCSHPDTFEHCDLFSNFETFIVSETRSKFKSSKNGTSEIVTRKHIERPVVLWDSDPTGRHVRFCACRDSFYAARKVNSVWRRVSEHWTPVQIYTPHCDRLVRFKDRIFCGGTAASRVRGKTNSQKNSSNNAYRERSDETSCDQLTSRTIRRSWKLSR